MSLLDTTLQFIPLTGQSMVGAAGVAIPSVGIIDLLGVGVGVAPPSIIGNVSTFGSNPGVGGGYAIPQLAIATGTAFTTATAATLTIALQMAPDLGAGGAYQPGTWQTIDQSPAMTAAQLVAGVRLWNIAWPPNFPKSLRPRYARLLFQVPAATNFTAGTIAYAAVVLNLDNLASVQAANNYVNVTL